MINKAQKAKEETERTVIEEQEGLNKTKEDMENVIKGTGSSDGTYNKAEIDKKVDKPSTINGKIPSENNPYIPEGFKPVNTDTSKWDTTEGPEVNKGLVISDGNSEFVFIPVASINDMVMCQTHGASQTIDQELLQCLVCKETTKLAGKLYTFSGTTVTVSPTKYTKNSGYREPDNLTDASYADNSKRLENETWTEVLYQKNFDNMVKSVAKNKGFYVGRYETSMNGTTAQSKAGQTPMNIGSWWKMYENSKMYSKSNPNLGVTSEMIWGCQWDAMLRFILTTEDASHVTATTNVSHNLPAVYKTGGTDYTGTVAYNDISANIYDLEGNCWEWTQVAYSTFLRVIRGGNSSNSNSPSNRFNGGPTGSNANYSSRLVLY